MARFNLKSKKQDPALIYCILRIRGAYPHHCPDELAQDRKGVPNLYQDVGARECGAGGEAWLFWEIKKRPGLLRANGG